MSKSLFTKAMSDSTTTWNGAESLPTPDMSEMCDGRLSLFFKSVRGINTPMLYKYLSKSIKENVIDTFLMSFHIRDCRGGKGEREIGRRCLIWLFLNKPQLFYNIIHLIPEYGRWDDLLYFFPNILNLSDIDYVRENYCSIIPDKNHLETLQRIQKYIVTLFSLQLIEDVNKMKEGKACSLVAKWSPTENDSLDKQYGVYEILATEMKISHRKLRKDFITPLRSYLNVVEKYMCNHNWDRIDYSKVPSYAMKRLKDSFEKHDSDRFIEWQQSLLKGEVKVNATQLFPHELVREMRIHRKADVICTEQWKILEREVNKLGSLDDCIAVVDTSSSMHDNNFIPFDVAIALGLLICKESNGPFKNNVITFDTNPKFSVINEGNLFDRWSQITEISWGGSTNIQSTFDMILSRATKFNLSSEDMPKKIFIISDMQFDNACRDKTNFELINEKYQKSGYKRPQIIFWNVNGSSTDFPVSVTNNGTALISGFSPSIMKSVLNGEKFSPYTIMRNTLDDQRLHQVKLCLE
jgi:hypothetical protein